MNNPKRTQKLFYGWYVAGVATLGYIGSGPGQTLIVSELNAPLTTSLNLQNADRDLSIAYLIATVAAGLLLTRIGKVIDALGSRKALAYSACAVAASCAVLGTAQNLAWILLGFFLVRTTGQGAIALASQHAVAMWFHRRLGVVNGYKNLVLNLVWAATPLVYLWLSDQVGWRWGYILLGATVAIVMTPLALLIVRDKPEEMGLTLDGDLSEIASEQDAQESSSTMTDTENPIEGFTLREAERTSAFWILVLVSVAFAAIGTAVLFHMQAFLTERSIGDDTASDAVQSSLDAARPIAAQAKSIWVLAMMCCALPAGALADRFQARAIFIAGIAMLGLSSMLLYMAHSAGFVYFGMAVLGVGHSLAVAAGATAPPRFYGRAHHGAIRGSISRIVIVGTAIGPALFVLPREFTDTFDVALVASAALCLPIALLSLRLVAPPEPKRP